MFSIRQSVKRLTHRFLLPERTTISVKGLLGQFKPTPSNSVHALLLLMNNTADEALPTGGGWRPYYRRRIPIPQDPNKYATSGTDMLSVKLSVKRLALFMPLEQPTISVRGLPSQFKVSPVNSLRGLLSEINDSANDKLDPFIDLSNVHRPLLPDSLSVKQAVRRVIPPSSPESSTISARNLLHKFKTVPSNSLRALLLVMNQIAEFDAIAAAAVATGAHSNFIFAQHREMLLQLGLVNRPDATVDEQAQDLATLLRSIHAVNEKFMQLQDYSYLAPPIDEPWPLEVLNFDALPFVGRFLNLPYISKSSPIFQTFSNVLSMMAYQDYFPTDTRKLAGSVPASEVTSVLADVRTKIAFADLNNQSKYLEDQTAISVAMGNLPTTIAPGGAGEAIGQYLRDLVSVGILQTSPGWCGTFGPGVDSTVSLIFNADSEGNYDMTQMHLIPLVYSYYDELSSDASEHLISQLLARGRIHGPNEDDRFTSGPPPSDWIRTGYISPLGAHKDLGETENHIFMIATARYLTNQLLYQRNPKQEDYDNRRNSRDGGPTCMAMLLIQLRNCLRDDFSEYNAKSYQEETRWALLNLCTYAYDHEVRLAARMVLDHVSTHIAVSSNDLRRVVPFRRRNDDPNVPSDDRPFADLGILDSQLGADPLIPYFALQTGNVRAFETDNPDPDRYQGNNLSGPVRPLPWSIRNGGGDIMKEVLSSYRLPPLLCDLFANDLHRRFFQRLHRTIRNDEVEGARNCDNMEINASSPSYLITAGGEPAKWALDPNFGPLHPHRQQQLGVAMPTTFMPTGQSAGFRTQNSVKNLILFSHFSDTYDPPDVENYGVAPDFACGYGISLPPWVRQTNGPWSFVNRGSSFVPSPLDPTDYVPAATAGLIPGFYLAIYQDGDYALLEAFDTWLHPDVKFDDFVSKVNEQNKSISLRPEVAETGAEYTTFYGTKINFVIKESGAFITNVTYSKTADATDAQGDAGNVTDKFLNGTILNSIAESVTEIRNPFFGQGDSKILLDMRDELHPRRISETGEVEQAGFNNEVWVNFGWKGPTEGDFFHPFNSMTAAADAVAPGGTIRVVSGWTNERAHFVGKKKYKVVIAGVGSARIGVH